MTEPEPNTEDHVSEEPLDLDAVPVRLSFDLGDRTVSLAELRCLQPGAVFDLQRPLSDGPVMIRANGALVGTGELVDLDGRIGVRVGTLGKGQA
ncbi:MAG TPA: type III secretion system cytoplasmic ring protein SctQ [Burkholderiaceae bacterium]|jgi:type III secretion protein Q|nr:type III secretion system cytoplasmic ring protein SctQ [Burkholderiaceae bacterium]